MSREPAWPWSVLGLPKAPGDASDLRRAYARSLKQIDQATDIDGFTALRAAYEEAGRRLAGKQARAAPRIPDTPPPPRETVSPVIIAGGQAVSLPPAPPPDPVLSATALRERAIDGMFQRLRTASIVEHLGDRILQCLANPLSQEQDVIPVLRREVVRLLRAQATHDKDDGLYLPRGLRPALLELDTRFHWMSDISAYTRDFWQDALMLDAMIACAEIRFTAPPQPALRRHQTRMQRAIAFFSSNTFWLGYVVVVVTLLALGNYTLDGPFEALFRFSFIFVFVSPLVIGLGFVAIGLWRFLRAGHIRERELEVDRRAMKRRGYVIKGQSRFKSISGTILLGTMGGVAAALVGYLFS